MSVCERDIGNALVDIASRRPMEGRKTIRRAIGRRTEVVVVHAGPAEMGVHLHRVTHHFAIEPGENESCMRESAVKTKPKTIPVNALCDLQPRESKTVCRHDGRQAAPP